MKTESNFLSKIWTLLGHKHVNLGTPTTTSDGEKTICYVGTVICRPKLFQLNVPAKKIKYPKEVWKKKIRQDAINDIIKIIDKRNEYNQKLAYYKREILLKELKDLV